MIRTLDLLKPWVAFRSSITGQYVSRAHALLHPHTTYGVPRERTKQP